MAGPDSVDVELAPVADDGVRAVQVGLVLWGITGCVLVLQRQSVADRGEAWWLMACGAGLIIGLVEWGIFARRSAVRRARADAGAADAS